MNPQNRPDPGIQLRIEDEDVLVALPPDEFDTRLRELVGKDEASELTGICQRIVFYRGTLPEAPKLWKERLWWLLAVLTACVVCYGLYSVAQKLL